MSLRGRASGSRHGGATDAAVRTRPVIIDIVGTAGTGKSTIADVLQQELADATLGPGEQPSVGVAESERVTHIERAAHLVRYPCLLLAAVRMAPIRKRKWSAGEAFTNHLVSLLRRSVLLRRASRAGQPFLVVPQGIIFQLRANPEVGIAKLPRRLRPSAVIELRVPPHERLARRINRDKEAREEIRTQQVERGRQVYSRLREGYDGHRAKALLERWNQRFCSPALSEDELSSIRREVETHLLPVSTPPGEIKDEDTDAVIEERQVAGVLWLEVMNDDKRSPRSVAVAIRERLVGDLLP